MINWKVRLKNKQWWLFMIPAVLVLVKSVAATLGFDIDIAFISDNVQSIVEAAFVVLALLGIVQDPTTKGLSDGEVGLTYTEPK